MIVIHMLKRAFHDMGATDITFRETRRDGVAIVADFTWRGRHYSATFLCRKVTGPGFEPGHVIEQIGEALRCPTPTLA